MNSEARGWGRCAGRGAFGGVDGGGSVGADLNAARFPTTVGQIGDLILGRYLLAFEVASVLLLAALIGAILLARGDEAS